MSAPERDVHDFVGELQLWDLLLDDGFLHCLLDDSGPLYFDCVDDVLNVACSHLR